MTVCFLKVSKRKDKGKKDRNILKKMFELKTLENRQAKPFIKFMRALIREAVEADKARSEKLI